MPVTYQYYDAGRTLSKRPKQTNDCVIRAEQSTYDTFKALNKKSGCGTAWQPYLSSKYQKLSFPAINKVTAESFIKEFPAGAKHIFAVKNGIIYDTCMPNKAK